MRVSILCLFLISSCIFSCRSKDASLSSIEGEKAGYNVMKVLRAGFPIYRVMSCEELKGCSPIHYVTSSSVFLLESEIPDNIYLHRLVSRSSDKPLSTDPKKYYKPDAYFYTDIYSCKFESETAFYREYVFRVDGKLLENLDENTVFYESFQASYVSRVKSIRKFKKNTVIPRKEYGSDACNLTNETETGELSFLYILGKEANDKYLNE